MPFKSDKQRKFIHYLRGKYSTKKILIRSINGYGVLNS